MTQFEWFSFEENNDEILTTGEKKPSTVQPDHPIEDGPESLYDFELQEQEQSTFDEITDPADYLDQDMAHTPDSGSSSANDIHDSHDAVEGTSNRIHLNFWSQVDQDDRSLISSLYGDEFVKDLDSIHDESLPESERLELQQEQEIQLLEIERADEASTSNETEEYSSTEIEQELPRANVVDNLQEVVSNDNFVAPPEPEPVREDDLSPTHDTFVTCR